MPRLSWKSLRVLLPATLLAPVLLACATVGQPFPGEAAGRLVIGQTTDAQVAEIFGPPWRTGLEDGLKSWTYGYYRYRLFSAARTRDLVIRFDDRNVVTSYSYSATPGEK